MPTNIEQRMPVGAVAGEPRDLDRQDDTNFPERHPGDQVLERLPMINSRAAHAEIAVDHVDISLMPAELAGSVLQRVLQAEALLDCQHLMRGGLSNVNHRPPPEMVRFDEFRAHRSSPGGRQRDPPRPAGARLAAGFARHRRARPASPLVPPATVSRSPSASKLSFVGS